MSAESISGRVGVEPRYPQVPESFVVDPMQNEVINDVMNTFFLDVLDCMGIQEDERGRFASIHVRGMYSQYSRAEKIESNDRITTLTALNRVVALAFEVRTDFNYIQAGFAHFLSPEMLQECRQSIRGIRELVTDDMV